MYSNLTSVDVVVNKIIESEEQEYLEIYAGEKYGTYMLPFKNYDLLPIKKGDKLNAMVGEGNIPDFIENKNCKKNIGICPHYIYSLWDKYSRVLYHNDETICIKD